MTTWEIYQGTGKRHDGLQRLPEPPGWREFQDVTQYQERKGTTFEAHRDQIQLVNAALYLRRPLLITGKPGTGKTSLAYSVAQELGLGEVLYWPITTRTTLKQGLYSYDAIGRLQDSQISDTPSDNRQDALKSIGKYIRLGPLGTALMPLSKERQDQKRPRVLLIDEIDKSDIDLPNDLLHTFEEGRFRIDELERIKKVLPKVTVSTAYTQDTEKVTYPVPNGQIQCNVFPFLILTSNGERDFPPPFLRRCIRLDMGQPNADELAEIVKRHLEALDPDVLSKAGPLIDAFVEKRDREALATDQLLNVVYLLLQQGTPQFNEGDKLTDHDLIDRLLKPLSGPGA